MAPERKGTIEPAGTWPDGSPRFLFRLRLADGTKSRRFPVPQGRDLRGARTYVTEMQAQEDSSGAILAAKHALERERAVDRGLAVDGETCAEWYERFMAYRAHEVGSVADDHWRWAKWIAPHIGAKPMRAVTPDDIENIRDALTAAVIAYEAASNVKGEGRLAPKSAQNAWTALTTPFKYASTRKGPRELRVREDLGNPCLGIPPPRDGASKKRHWCRPGEILAVVSCAEVARAWREAIAVGCYLHLRPGELHELRVKDLDLVAGEVRISRAYDERKKLVKAPKTDEGIRHVTIPAPLLPLLDRIARNGKAEDRVAPIVAGTDEYFRAGLFRGFLGAAGVDRAELFVETPTHLMIDFRSLRDSGITWRFLAGERAEVVQREAGHDQIATTLGYAKEVHARGGRFGEPFPALPADLIAGAGPSAPAAALDQPSAHLMANAAKQLWAQRDLKTATLDASTDVPALALDEVLADASIGARQRADASANGPGIGPASDEVEVAISRALEAATTAGRFNVVAQLARELEARRLAREPNVIALDTSRPRRGRR